MTLATPPVTDPPAAVAVAMCYLARRLAELGTTGSGRLLAAITTGHPRPCEFCDYPTETLVAYAREYLAWATDGAGDFVEPGVVKFMSLPRREQRRLRYLAQYAEEPAAADGSVQERIG